jgi:hypothetical protein
MGVRVSSQYDQGTDRLWVFVPCQGVDGSIANVGILMAAEAGRRDDCLGSTEVGERDQDRVEHVRVRLVLQHAQESVQARLGEGPIRNSELPEDVRSEAAFARAGAPAEPDGSVQYLAGSPPVQGHHTVPVRILVGPAKQVRDQLAHGAGVILRVGRNSIVR